MIDDEVIILEVMKCMLECLGFSVDSAINGQEGLRLVTERSNMLRNGRGKMYDLIFCDYNLPVMDGPQTA